jgi:hypothetical protein
LNSLVPVLSQFFFKFKTLKPVFELGPGSMYTLHILLC